MINSVKEFRQVNLDSKCAFLLDGIPYLPYRLFGISIRSEAKAISRKEGVKQRSEYLSNGLLYHSVNDVRDPQLAFTSIGFIHLYTSDR
jgi:hypothetical protein